MAAMIAAIFNVLMGATLAEVVGFDPVMGAAAFLTIGVAAGYLGRNEAKSSGLAFAGLYQEVWIKGLRDNLFYGAAAFLARMRDYTEYVNYNTLNFAVLGTTPTVSVNTAGPFTTTVVADTNSTVALDVYNTTNTAIPNARYVERAPDAMEAYLQKHRNVLREYFGKNALWNYAPAANATLTPVIATTGAANGANSHKRMVLADIINLQAQFDNANLPLEGRVLVLHPNHRADLLAQDVALFKAFTDPVDGKLGHLYGFDIYVSSLTPYYDASLSTKVPFGSTILSTYSNSSIAFLESESCRAEGDYELFHLPKEMDPVNRQETIGFQARFVAKPVRAVGYAAIVSLP